VWLALAILTLGGFLAGLPVYLTQLQTPCASTTCEYGVFLTPEQVGVLKGIGLSLGDYAAYNVALALALVVICLVVSTVIIWRRSDDRMALLVALMLVTLGPGAGASPSPWQVLNECLSLLLVALFLLVFSLFPTGRFVPSFMRWAIVVFLVGPILLTFF